MGLVAGSSVMLLTALWGACLILGRCDLVPHPTNGTLVAKDRTLTKGFSLTGTLLNALLKVSVTPIHSCIRANRRCQIPILSINFEKAQR